jgi:hypothetical protein
MAAVTTGCGIRGSKRAAEKTFRSRKTVESSLETKEQEGTVPRPAELSNEVEKL